MGAWDFESLRPHAYHKIICVVYGVLHKDEKNVAVECLDCHEVLLDFDRNELPGHDESTIQQGDTHYFNIQIFGKGPTRTEAWIAAIKNFTEEPGEPPDEPAVERREHAEPQQGGTHPGQGDPPQPGGEVSGGPV